VAKGPIAFLEPDTFIKASLAVFPLGDFDGGVGFPFLKANCCPLSSSTFLGEHCSLLGHTWPFPFQRGAAITPLVGRFFLQFMRLNGLSPPQERFG